MENFIFCAVISCRSTCLDKQLFFRYFYSKQGKRAVPKSNCHKKLLILKKWLHCRIFVLKKSYSEKITAAKVTVLKKVKKAAALKKYLLRKCDCCVEVVTLKKCEKVACPKIELSCKSRNTCEKGNRYLKEKKTSKLGQ